MLHNLVPNKNKVNQQNFNLFVIHLKPVKVNLLNVSETINYYINTFSVYYICMISYQIKVLLIYFHDLVGDCVPFLLKNLKHNVFMFYNGDYLLFVAPDN